MSLGNNLMALGQWIEKRFPEKLTAADVRDELADMGRRLNALSAAVAHTQDGDVAMSVRLTDLEKKSETVNSDLNKVKVMLLAQRPR